MNIHELPTPCYVIDEKKLKENLEILAGVRDRTECRILLAQKDRRLSGRYHGQRPL